MQSLYNFIIEPENNRYNNEIDIDGKKLIINTTMDDHKFVNRVGIVKSIPLVGKTNIKVGDKVIVHHNVFRRFYDIKGNEKNSKSFFKDNLYFVQPDQIYLYKNKNKWISFGDRCFVNPLRNNDDVNANIEESLIGILKYSNNALEALGINEGDVVGYKPFGEFDFLVDGKRLYCMKSNDIVIKYERQGNEKEYNPSWAQSS